MEKGAVHEILIELLAIPPSDQRTVAKWLVNERREKRWMGWLVVWVCWPAWVVFDKQQRIVW